MRGKKILASILGALSGAVVAALLAAAPQTEAVQANVECTLASVPHVAHLVWGGAPGSLVDTVRQAH